MSDFANFFQKGVEMARQKKTVIFLSLRTSLMNIWGKLAEGGSVSVTVGVSDM